MAVSDGKTRLPEPLRPHSPLLHQTLWHYTWFYYSCNTQKVGQVSKPIYLEATLRLNQWHFHTNRGLVCH